jgi:hypothetical protein
MSVSKSRPTGGYDLTVQGAFDIIGLALDTLQPQPSSLPTILASRDLPDVMLYDRPVTPPRVSTPVPVFKRESSLVDSCIDHVDHMDHIETEGDTIAPPSSFSSNYLNLIHRPKSSSMSIGYIVDSASEDEGFSIVHRPRPTATFEEPMSSPEIVPSNPIDILAATGSNYPDDDDWTML